MQAAWQRLNSLGRQIRQLGSAEERQRCWLLDCLQRNQATEQGRRLGFAHLRSSEDYRAAVPMTSYEDYRPWIERIAAGEADVLFAGHAVAFERTSGSSGGSKLVPYSAASLADFRVAVLPWLANLIEAGDLGSGSAYWAISPALRPPQRTGGGIPVGLPDAAFLGAEAAQAFLATLAVPEWVAALTSLRDWQRATLYWLVRRDDLELISIWSPTFFLMLLDALSAQAAELDAILRNGGSAGGRSLSADEPARRRLEAWLREQDLRLLWPKLKLVSCWADASSQPFFCQLKARLPHAAFQPKGLLSTEAAVTAPDQDGRTVLTASSGFYEFADAASTTWLAHELQAGQCCEVVVTTSGGLHRCRTGDQVLCLGQHGGLPELRFIGRCGLTSDLTGEKLTDEFVGRCLQDVPGFRMLVPAVRADGPPRYVLVLNADVLPTESQLQAVEAALSKNSQYAHSRQIGQLAPLAALRSKDPVMRLAAWRMQAGTRLGDVKMQFLCPDPDVLNAFAETTP